MRIKGYVIIHKEMNERKWYVLKLVQSADYTKLQQCEQLTYISQNSQGNIHLRVSTIC